MATFAPARPSALAITLPNPVELPVTSATLPFKEKRSLLMNKQKNNDPKVIRKPLGNL